MKLLFLSLLFGFLFIQHSNASSLADQPGSNPYASCIFSAAKLYQISPNLIDAIIRVESNHNPNAINVNTNGSVDIGLMQVNADFWLPHITPLGYSRDKLFEPCINTFVGTWILSQEMQRFGYTWEAVGAYNAGPSAGKDHRRLEYARRVFNLLNQ